MASPFSRWFQGAANLFSSSSDGPNSPILWTGLKAIDLLLPIPRGGDVLISGEPRSGARVLANEVAYRLLHRPDSRPGSRPGSNVRIACYLDSGLNELEACEYELREALPEVTDIHRRSSIDTQDLKSFRSTGSTDRSDLIFAVSHDRRFLHDFQQSVRLERENPSSKATLTTFLVTEQINLDPFDAKWFCSQMIGKQGIYPAIDLSKSFSKVSEHPSILAAHRKIAAGVRDRLIEVTASLYEGALKDASWIGNREPSKIPMAQALCFLSQSYFVAEPYTGMKSSFVPLKNIEEDFGAILNGQCAREPLSNFMYKDRLTK